MSDRKSERRNIAPGWTDARPVPLDEMDAETLRYVIRLTPEASENTNRFLDLVKRGLVPAIAPPASEFLSDIEPKLSTRQVELLRWLAARDGRAAPLSDVTMYRIKYKKGLKRVLTKGDWRSHRKFCERLRVKLVSLGTRFQLHIKGNAVCLVIDTSE
jgi:hypothetical protein